MQVNMQAREKQATVICVVLGRLQQKLEQGLQKFAFVVFQACSVKLVLQPALTVGPDTILMEPCLAKLVMQELSLPVLLQQA